MKNQLGDMTLRELAESLGFQEYEYRELLKLVVQVGRSDLNEILLEQRENDPKDTAWFSDVFRMPNQGGAK